MLARSRRFLTKIFSECQSPPTQSPLSSTSSLLRDPAQTTVSDTVPQTATSPDSQEVGTTVTSPMNVESSDPKRSTASSTALRRMKSPPWQKDRIAAARAKWTGSLKSETHKYKPSPQRLARPRADAPEIYSSGTMEEPVEEHALETLIVMNIGPQITEEDLWTRFDKIARMRGTWIVRNWFGETLTYAFIRFRRSDYASRIMQLARRVPIFLDGRPITLRWAHGDHPPPQRNHLIVIGLSMLVTEEDVGKLFHEYDMRRVIIQMNPQTGRYARVHFWTEDGAAQAYLGLRDARSKLGGYPVSVVRDGWITEDMMPSSVLCLKALPKEATEAHVQALFMPFGDVVKRVAMPRGERGAQHAFVTVSSVEVAQKVWSAAHKRPFTLWGRTLRVGFARPPTSRITIFSSHAHQLKRIDL
ncbi:uncharacterized protein LAESUDRAFT_728698 [Laetiporus sulphureus 93-53]|uniref:RRM domain-containing protein n=1 Tax=Laetiporus sulphureus 93-53 TaxID=1314785 RepID=A0A165D1U7_9APHY|nr:uncharacterized protein LAESUDRAFT_728698 [Laetiporus sulphureus 93-53]KZT03983.1 hypothetical protein LAESUDRAFT_728698 [Laetiporus sulphureus 93-53]